MRLKKLWRLDAATLLIPIVLFATAIGGSVATGAAPPPPVAAYSFDAGSGSTLVDLSGNGNTGAISGATWTTGKTGKALNFDGSNDWVTIADSVSLDLTTGMTLEAWVRPTQNGGRWRTVVFKESASGTVYSLYTGERNNRPIGQVNIAGERNVLGSSLPLSTWTHLAVTYDGSKLRLYTNGALTGSVDVRGSIPTTGSPLRIGGNAIWGEWFAGQIDDLRIYNRALDASELQTDMKTAVGTPAAPPSDTQPPTAPSSLSVTGRTTSSISIAWTAATDNTGVSKYGLYRDAASVGTTPSTSATFSGLTCDTTYALSVEALDAAGNRSTKSSVAASTAACPTSAGGPVAAYSFDASSGTTLADASGKGNSGTIANATWGAGKNGGGLVFDGSNDSVTIADAAALDLSTGMTLEAWVKPSAGGATWRTVIFKETADGTAYSLYSNESTGVPVGQVNIGGERDAKGATLPLDTWSHLAATYDGSSLRLYRNGVQESSIPVSGSIPASSGPLRLGGNSIWGEWFAGQIDDVRVYARALTSGQIQADMATPVGNSSSPTPPPTDPGPPTDTQAPSTPGNLALSGKTVDTITVSWTASNDNVAVTGYGRYRNGNLVANVSGTSHTYADLSCGTSYTLTVDAYDAAGNRSARSTSLSATTAACPPPPPPPSGGTPGSADLYVSTGGSDTGQCTQVAPCRSFDRAYRLAKPGATIEIAGGSYPDQRVNADPAKPVGSASVLFRPAAGASMTVSRMESYANDVRYVDFKLPVGQSSDGGAGVFRVRGGKNVLIENAVGTKPDIWNTNGIDNLTIRGGNWGPYPSCGGGFAIADNPTNVLIEGNTFHDYTVPSSCPGAHLDCMHVYTVTRFTARGNTFRNCENFGIFLSDGQRDVLIENNTMEGGISGLKFRGDTDPSIEVFTNVTLRGNQADEIMMGSTGSNTLINVRVENNHTTNGIGPCRAGVVFTGNTAVNGSACG